jgi:hypothetical protein|tara:strand:- start:916 stop:1449 length:534 start_codon:yes stop_codon:yes gene_type:complete
MATGYEPNVEGAIAVLVDLMTANDFTMTRQPYEPNYRGLIDAVIDLKEGFPTFVPVRVGFDATAFEAVGNGDALYMRTSDGQVGKASASNGNLENALVVGFANSAVSSGSTVKVIVTGVKTMTGTIDPGDIYYLSPSTAGAITLTAPTSSGQAVTRVGEGATATDFSIQIEPPVLLG